MASDNLRPSLLAFSEAEENILELYDNVQELQLQLALLTSRQLHTHPVVVGPQSEINDATATESQKHLLEAKATLAVRDSVVESVVTAPPTLKAVHHATHASPIERDLFTYIEQRDKIAKNVAQKGSRLKAARESLLELEVERLRSTARNVELASETLQLANKTREHKPLDVDDELLKRNLDSLENQAKASRQRWRVMKGAASAIVAGSGMDWVRDGRLRALVLDPAD